MNQQRIKGVVMQFTGITEEQYHLHIFESGIDYATVFSGGNEMGASALTHTQEFWNWYQQQFFSIDEVYNSLMQGRGHDKATALRIWKNRHRAAEMKSYPTSDVLNQGTRQLQSLHRDGIEL